jgi:hypothetical protein
MPVFQMSVLPSPDCQRPFAATKPIAAPDESRYDQHAWPCVVEKSAIGS